MFAKVAVAKAAEPNTPRPPRRGRTRALFAAAAVLGIVAGACAGYLVQADREPTGLPPLSQPVVAQAKGAVEPLSAAQDRRVKTDGDLRKLLLSRPKGAEDGFLRTDDGWLDQAAYAGRYGSPAYKFDDLTNNEFRRAAGTSWREDGTRAVEIFLVQFRQEQKAGASELASDSRYWALAADDVRSWAVPGTGDGRAYVRDTPDRKPGYPPVYRAEAYAWRGDIAMEVLINDTEPIPKAKIMDLAERQMDEL